MWESGSVKLPRRRFRSALEAIFGLSVEELFTPERTNGAAPKGDAVNTTNSRPTTNGRKTDA
jgi:hypothetical protein